MAYPQFSQKIEIVQKKFKIDPGAIAKKIAKDKTTIWRWLQTPQKLNDNQQKLLVDAICDVLGSDEVKISEEIFRENNILMFCIELGIPKLEAAIMTRHFVPVPDIFVDSVFQYSPNLRGFVGHYLQYKYDNSHGNGGRPYVQKCTKLSIDDYGRLTYEDVSIGEGDMQSSEGFAVPVGLVTNIVGQRKNSDPQASPEIFWCGLKRVADESGKAVRMYGYMSGVTSRGALSVSRVVFARTDENEWERTQKSNEGHVTRTRVVQTIGADFAKYLDDWKSAPPDDLVRLTAK